MEEGRKKGLTILYMNKKMQILFFLGSMFIVFILYFSIKNQINISDIKKNDFFGVCCQVDLVKEDEENIVLSGFAFQLKQDAKKGMFKLILSDIETGEMYYPKMDYNSRKDVNDYFLCEYDYTESGFIAKISLKKINTVNKIYELLLQPIGKKAYALGIYYTNGEIYCTNPKEFVPLDVEGTDLEKIIKQGVLLVYRPDYGMYVYQYEGDLYWIADENYYFEEDNTTYIQYQLWTTQIENLPQYRQENNWFFDNIGFYFEEKELQDMNTGNYRVAKKELPTKYSIHRIETGYYVDGKWIWQNHFLPYFEFTKQ